MKSLVENHFKPCPGWSERLDQSQKACGCTGMLHYFQINALEEILGSKEVRGIFPDAHDAILASWRNGVVVNRDNKLQLFRVVERVMGWKLDPKNRRLDGKQRLHVIVGRSGWNSGDAIIVPAAAPAAAGGASLAASPGADTDGAGIVEESGGGDAMDSPAVEGTTAAGEQSSASSCMTPLCRLN